MMRIISVFGILAVLLCGLLPAFPTDESPSLRLPTIIGDHMILQQEARNTIWGWAAAGATVKVSASWEAEASAEAGEDGTWKVFLETPAARTGETITVSAGDEKITIRNVAVGEVWLCAGQSNMGWALQNTFGSEEAMATATAPDYRIFDSCRMHWHEPMEDTPGGGWAPCTPETAAETSAVSFYFGRKLHEVLGIPVGIIVRGYAGTPIEGWMPFEVQKDNPASITLQADVDGKPKRPSKEEALEQFRKELAEYEKLVAAEEDRKPGGRRLKRPIITKPAALGHQVPGNIYNGMIHPIRPYGIRGAIWYQGERNSKNPRMAVGYRSQLALLIRYYRESWHAQSGGNTDPEFPFHFTQLPCWAGFQEKPAEGEEAPWAINRESMRLVLGDLPHVGMAVAIDTGDPFELHPKNKKPIGLRHAFLALKNVYGKREVGCGPLFREKEIDGPRIVLRFDSIGSGLMTAREGNCDAFAVCGADGVWHWADAVIEGEAVAVSSEKVPEPKHVRYAWAMNPSRRNLLYNREGFPASPFRTDDKPLCDKEYGREFTYDDPKSKRPADYEPKDWERPEMTK